jgi:hypothetical protein
MATLPPGFEIETRPQPSQAEKVKIPEGFAKERTFFDDIKGVIEPIDVQLRKLPGSRLISEAVSAANRGVIGIAQSLVGDPINAALQLAGSEAQLPQFTDLPLVKEATKGEALEPGLFRDVVRAGGEVAAPGALIGGLARGVAAQIPAQIAARTKLGEFGATAAGAVKQLGAGTAVGDVAASALSGAGATAGEKVGGTPGAIVGGLVAPLSGVAIKSLASAGLSSVSKALSASAKGMSDEGASKLFAEAMIREGVGPDDVIKRLQELGPEAIPADAGPVFARLLKSAADQVGRIQGRAASELGKRQLGQGARIATALDDGTGTTGLSVRDEIVRLNDDLGPQITKLYDDASAAPFTPSKRLNTLLSGDNSAARAAKKAQTKINDALALGERVGPVDKMDAIKRELGDQIGVAIRAGEADKARTLVKMKNLIVDEVDKAAPVYKQARDLFAGKKTLESAAEQGALFTKMNSRDVVDITKAMSKSEKDFFKLGAKQDILDRIAKLRTNANAVDRLFGKNGDVDKLRALFDDSASFEGFKKALKTESDFAKTKASLGGSPTFKNFVDSRSAIETLDSTRQALTDPVQAANISVRVLKGIFKRKGTQENIDAFEAVGDILLTKGMSADKIRTLLQKGSAKSISEVFKKAIKADIQRPRTAAIAAGITPTLESDQ